MKLENQVCSLELAKKLKELGVKQESLFYWRYNDGMDEWFIDEWDEFGPGKEFISSLKATSAFTVAELLEMLKEPVLVPVDGSAADYLAKIIIRQLEN